MRVLEVRACEADAASASHAGKAPFGLIGLERIPLGPSLICYRHETDKSENRIIGPKLVEPVRIEVITQRYCTASQNVSPKSTG